MGPASLTRPGPAWGDRYDTAHNDVDEADRPAGS